MDAIEKMIERMNEQATLERQTIEEERLSKIEADFESQQALLLTENETQIQRQNDQIEKKYKQQRDRQQVAFRQAALHEKQRVLSQFFDNATEQMNSWSHAEMQQFCEKLLQQAQLKQPLTIVVGELSTASLDQAWVNQMNQRHALELSLSEQTLSKQAGFVLHDNGVQYNFIFENLIKDVQTTMGFELAKRLFE